MSNNNNFKEWKDVWNLTEFPDNVDFDKNKAYADFLSKIAQPTEIAVERNNSRYIYLKYWKSAVAAIFLGVISALLFTKNDMTDLSANEIATEYILPDNSKVILYPESKISYDKSNFMKTRKVVLQGKALFDVVKSKENFKIVQGDVTVTVYGTSFIVSPSEVKVLEGKVRVVSPQGNIYLNSREKVNLKSKILSVESANFSYEVLSSITMSYENEPIAKIISDMEAKFEISVENPLKIDVSTCLITATNLSKSSKDECFKILASVSGLRLSSLDEENYTIADLNCK